jgi:hypothetical protein
MKIHPVGAELFQVDRWTGMIKLLVIFCNFAKSPKNEFIAYLMHNVNYANILWGQNMMHLYNILLK